jgi:hypothetical protein
MKKLLVLTAVLFFTSCCPDKPKPQPNADGIITLKVQVLDNLDSLKKTVPKATEAVAENIFRFKVLEVINGTYNKTEIKIKILAPLEAINAKRLETGKTYIYKLIPGSYINAELKTVPTDYYERLEYTATGSQL